MNLFFYVDDEAGAERFHVTKRPLCSSLAFGSFDWGNLKHAGLHRVNDNTLLAFYFDLKSPMVGSKIATVLHGNFRYLLSSLHFRPVLFTTLCKKQNVLFTLVNPLHVIIAVFSIIYRIKFNMTVIILLLLLLLLLFPIFSSNFFCKPLKTF